MYRLIAHMITYFAIALLLGAPETGHAVDFDAMQCGSLDQPACSVAPAAYESQKPSGCPKGSFFDPIDGGSCWSCPSGTVRNVTAVDSANACMRPPGETAVKAKRHGRGKGLLGTDCDKGEFWDPNGSCWSCPRGYTRTAAPVTAKNACTKWRGPSFTKAALEKRLACPDGSFFDPSRGGSCWSCPEGYVRTLAGVSASNACAAGNLVAGVSPVLGLCDDGLANVGGRCYERNRCGALGERPCLLVERIPSCDAGLAEDFINNRCVEDRLAETACRALVGALWGGQEVAALLSQAPKPADLLDLALDQHGTTAELRRKVDDARKRGEEFMRDAFVKRVIPEAEPIVALLNNPASGALVREIFSADTICGGDLERMDRLITLYNLVPPSVLAEIESARPFPGIIFGALPILGISSAHADEEFDPIPLANPLWRHFFIGYQLTLSGAKGVGGGISITGVTDLRGNGGFYLAPHLQAVTNIGGGVDVRLPLFSKANMSTFKGLGFGLGATGPSPKGGEVVSLGVDLIFEPDLFLPGAGLGAGAGMSKLPGDVGLSAAWSFPLNQYCASTPDQACENCSCLK
ncbi:MAG: hypothetical protein WD078_14100 [Woeseia sp.]